MRIALLCQSPLRHDSRVLRHASFLMDAGFEVVIFAETPLPDHVPCRVVEIGHPAADWRLRARLLLQQGPATVLPASALPLYWASAKRWRAHAALVTFRPDLIIANDWKTLPIATTVRRATGARIIYDSHEFAVGEFEDSLLWRLAARRHVVEIERRFIRQADAVMTVSGGLADALVQRYRLSPRPTVVLNAPERPLIPFRPTGKDITVLYHGIVAPRRGLEAMIESVGHWPEQFGLVIRGDSAGEFGQILRHKASSLGKRVRFEAAVDPADVVLRAASADIGLFLFAPNSRQAQVVLPNKIFEYMAAGLMVIASDLPETRPLFASTGVGLLLGDMSPAGIAAAIGNLTPDEIDRHKRASLASADRFDSQSEAKKLKELIAQVMSPG